MCQGIYRPLVGGDWGGGRCQGIYKPLVVDDWGRVRESIGPWWGVTGGVSGIL